MDTIKPTIATMAQQVAEVAKALQRQRTGHAPKAVTVVMSEDTLVVTLHGALTPAEQSLAKSREGAAQVQEFHRQLFRNSVDSLWKEITKITGREVRSGRGNRPGHRKRRTRIYHRHDGAGVPARRERTGRDRCSE